MISHACQPLGVFKGGVSEIRKARGFHWTSAGGSLCCLQLGDNELALAEAGMEVRCRIAVGPLQFTNWDDEKQ